MLTLNLNLRKRLLLLLCFFIVGFFMSGVVAMIIDKLAGITTPGMRIAILFQDILMFILPAIATAMLVTRQPAELLDINGRLPLKAIVCALFVVVAMTPAMNVIIWLNANVPLPETVARAFAALEDNSNSQIQAVLGAHTIPNLIISILIIGVMAGFSEELFFRAGLQRLLLTGGVNKHVALWSAAMVFSFMHMQFYGFVPRMLLGALFGYAFMWTRSIWVPVLMHTFNNTLYLLAQWFSEAKAPSDIDLDNIGITDNMALNVGAVILSIICVYFGLKSLYKYRE